MNWILNFQVVSDVWSYAFIILRKDSLENNEIILGHFEGNLITNVNKLSIYWIFAHIEGWWLK